MNQLRITTLIAAAVCIMPFCRTAAAVDIETVFVDDPGNAADPLTGFGAVDYEYEIGKYEVTNAQYAEFLNAVAKTDPYELYNIAMTNNARGGITRAVVNSQWEYTVKENYGNKPVITVSFFDAARFANWLHNGQPTGEAAAGSTESGAYTLTSATPDNATVTRNPDATWFIPTVDEWYKSAYYQPFESGGDSDGYWSYATATNEPPNTALANEVGDISNPGANIVNYKRAANWDGSTGGNVTTVGSAGPLSESYYGTADQSGNLAEWVSTIFSTSFRGAFGGPLFAMTADGLLPSAYFEIVPTTEAGAGGFRVARAVPEPSAALLLSLAALAMLHSSRARSVLLASGRRA